MKAESMCVQRLTEDGTVGHSQWLIASSKATAVRKYCKQFCGSLGMIDRISFKGKHGNRSRYDVLGTSGRTERFIVI